MTYRMKPSRLGAPVSVHRARKRRCEKYADAGFNLSQAAESEGITRAALWQWLNRKGFHDLRRRLADNARWTTLSSQEVVSRLRVVQSSKTQRVAAKHLGISDAAMCDFLKRYAPEGIEDALELYEVAA